MTAQNCWNIYNWHALNIEGRDNFERVQERPDFWLDLRLQGSHHNVLSTLLAPACFVEHAKRLADPRGIAEKYL
jgi:hypothetical protein